MTWEFGHTQQQGYELWDIFAEQAIRHFSPTFEEEVVVPAMLIVRYRNDINQFLTEFKN